MPSTRKQQIGFRRVGSDSETSWDNEPRKEERYARIRARVPTGHPGLAKKLLQMQHELLDEQQEESDVISSDHKKSSKSKSKTSSKSKKSSSEKKSSSKRKKYVEVSTSDEEPVVKVGKKKKSSSKHDEVQIGRATVIDGDGDSSWEEETRKQERFARIRKRVPTGHPGLAKKIRNALMDSEEEIVGVSSDEETEASPPERASRRPIHFGEAKAVDGSDDSWDDRHRKEERFTRIRTRVPTGHPGLAKKVAQLRMQMMDSDSSVEIKQKKSKSRVRA